MKNMMLGFKNQDFKMLIAYDSAMKEIRNESRPVMQMVAI